MAGSRWNRPHKDVVNETGGNAVSPPDFRNHAGVGTGRARVIFSRPTTGRPCQPGTLSRRSGSGYTMRRACHRFQGLTELRIIRILIETIHTHTIQASQHDQ
jgi:hypothetical protein